MFPLTSTTFPSSAADLARLLTESLQQILLFEPDPITIHERSYPHLSTLFISLDHARLRPDPPQLPAISGETLPGLKIDHLTLTAAPLSVGPAAVDVSLSALQVVFGQAKDVNGRVVLTVEGASEGRIEVSANQADLEALLAGIAKVEAGKQGVTIRDVHLTVRARNARSLEMEVCFHAQKLFMSAPIRINGRVDLDNDLCARISGLKCEGDGALARIACGVLRTHLEKLEGREFPLMSLPLGKIQLRDIRIAAAERLSVIAEFGSS